jgi:hypothetical protein
VGNVRVAAVRRRVVDRTRLQAALEQALGALHTLQLLIAKGEVSGAHPVVVAVHEARAIESGGGLHVGASYFATPKSIN